MIIRTIFAAALCATAGVATRALADDPIHLTCQMEDEPQWEMRLTIDLAGETILNGDDPPLPVSSNEKWLVSSVAQIDEDGNPVFAVLVINRRTGEVWHSRRPACGSFDIDCLHEDARSVRGVCTTGF